MDGDVEEYKPDIIEKMTRPILNNKADFIKGTFAREAGRVTELVAKPLLVFNSPARWIFPAFERNDCWQKRFFEK